MAVQISINTAFNVPATYWNIALVQQNFRDANLSIKMFGYADQAARIANAQPMSSAEVVYDQGNFKPDLTRTQLYDLIKLDPQFEGATDC